jgi:hypothetical protein
MSDNLDAGGPDTTGSGDSAYTVADSAREYLRLHGAPVPDDDDTAIAAAVNDHRTWTGQTLSPEARALMQTVLDYGGGARIDGLDHIDADNGMLADLARTAGAVVAHPMSRLLRRLGWSR